MKIKQHPGTGLWVTDDGRVIQPPCRKFPKFRFTYGYKNMYGYMVVEFRCKPVPVHKLVIEAFIENKSGLPTVDHINRDKLDNRLENLRYASHKMQADNKQCVDNSLAKYGVRKCEDSRNYQRALYANNPEFAERKRARERERYAGNAERIKTRVREWEAKQRAQGKRRRRCPDGKQRFLTDEEFDARYKKD